MLLNSHISAYARCLAWKVCGLVRSTWGTSQGEDKLGAKDKILNTKVARRPCAGPAPDKHYPQRKFQVDKVTPPPPMGKDKGIGRTKGGASKNAVQTELFVGHGWGGVQGGGWVAPPPLHKPTLCITALMKEISEPLALNRRLGLRPPHSSHNLSRHTGSSDRIQGGSGLGLVHVNTLRQNHEVWPIGCQQLPQDHMICRGAHTPCV